MKNLAFLILAAGLSFTACDSPNRTDNLAPVNRDEDTQPGNENDPAKDELTGDLQSEVGTVNSYPSDDDPGSKSYDNVFRRDKDDADFAVLTDNDMDMPHSADGLADAPSTPNPNGEYEVEDRARENLKYGSNRSSEYGNDRNEVGVAENDTPQGGNQDAIGATGYANYKLESYYDTDEEDYYAPDNDEASGNSFIRPLRNKESYNEQVVRVGAASAPDYQERYAELKRDLYSIPENQQSVLYAPNVYQYNFLTTWSGMAKSAQASTDNMKTREVAYDRPPLMGSGCEQADDPMTCSTGKLGGQLNELLSDPRLIRTMQRSGIEGVRFEVNENGEIARGSLRAQVNQADCRNGDCARFNRALEDFMRNETWMPAQRKGVPTPAMVRLPLRGQPAADS